MELSVFSTKSYADAPKLRCVMEYKFRVAEKRRQMEEDLRRKGLNEDEITELLGDTSISRDDSEAINRSVSECFCTRPSYLPYRFNTVRFPALYTTKEAATAVAELRHHVTALKPDRPVPYVVYEVLFTGTVVDLRQCKGAVFKLKPDDYADCQDIASKAHDALYEGVASSSAITAGNCCAIFREGSVKASRVLLSEADIMN